MSYIENVYICLAAPVLLAILCLRREGRRSLIFVLSGMTVCLLSAYISTFLAGAYGVDLTTASYELSPIVEEVMKAVPLLFYLLIFEAEKGVVISGALLEAVGFATFENVCFLTSYGTSNVSILVIRGFGTGAMHVVCGMVVAIGLFFLWDNRWLQMIGGFALLSFVITFHAIFNLLVSQSGPVFWVGSLIPLILLLVYLLFFHKRMAVPH